MVAGGDLVGGSPKVGRLVVIFESRVGERVRERLVCGRLMYIHTSKGLAINIFSRENNFKIHSLIIPSPLLNTHY